MEREWEEKREDGEGGFVVNDDAGGGGTNIVDFAFLIKFSFMLEVPKSVCEGGGGADSGESVHVC